VRVVHRQRRGAVWRAAGAEVTLTRARILWGAVALTVVLAIAALWVVPRLQPTTGTLVVVGAGFFFHLSGWEWCWIVLALSIVWTAEALNTAFEFLADAASPNFHPLVRDAKDVAAGAVLITAIAASIIGAIIFWPYLAKIFS